MQTGGRNERLAESGEKMILHGLRVAGESGRARASLGESRVTIEFKNGNCIDIRYDQILRMQHHNTTLVPGWVAFVGLCLFYASWRVITPPNIRLAVLALGLAMISGWVLTKRPTLTLDTKLGDCHVLHAIDSRLLKFSTMIQRMNDGLTLEEARIGVDLLNEDAEFPRQTAQLAAQALPVPAVAHWTLRGRQHNHCLPGNPRYAVAPQDPGYSARDGHARAERSWAPARQHTAAHHGCKEPLHPRRCASPAEAWAQSLRYAVQDPALAAACRARPTSETATAASWFS